MNDCLRRAGGRPAMSICGSLGVSITFVLAIFLPVTLPPAAAATAPVPVTIGEHGEDFDACPTFGELRRDAVLRAAPSARAEAEAALPRGAALHLCVDAPDGR
jgi:hypothetical protein